MNLQYRLKQAVRAARAVALNLTDLEIKVEEATNNDTWGPHGGLLREITDASHDHDSYKEIMGVLARRLQDEGPDWRHVYKALLTLEYMLKNGPPKILSELQNNIDILERLRDRFHYVDPKGKDHGLNVRHRAKELAALVQDPERVQEERRKARQLAGVANDGVTTEGRLPRNEERLAGAASGWREPEVDVPARPMPRGTPRVDVSPKGSGTLDVPPAAAPAGGAAADLLGGMDEPAAPAAASAAEPADDAAAAPPAKGAQPQRPKKLSQVKVRGDIAATFQGMKLAAPPAARAPTGAAATFSAPAPPAASAAPPAPSMMDDLLGLDATPAQAAPAPAAAAPAASADDAWGLLGGSSAEPAAAAPPAADDDAGWASFAQPSGGLPQPSFGPVPVPAPAPTHGAAAPPPDPFDALVGGGGGAAAATAATATAPAQQANATGRAPLPDDLFSDMGGTSGGAVQGGGGFGGWPAATPMSQPAQGAALLGGVGGHGHAMRPEAGGGPTAANRSAPPAKKDPFADLLG